LHGHELNRCSISWSCWDSFVSCDGGATHLVHPGATVVFVAAKAKASFIDITMNLDIETRVFHVGIDLVASIPLTELDALAVALHDFEYEL